MYKVTVEDLSLRNIYYSGQVFRMEKDPKYDSERYCLYNRDNSVIVQQVSEKADLDTLLFYCSKEEYKGIWKHYLGLDENDKYVYARSLIPEFKDVYLSEAAETVKGMRILRQDFWETAVSFVISQNNNIPRIMKIINNLVSLNNNKFPNPVELHSLLCTDSLGLGYRHDYLAVLCSYWDEIACKEYLTLDAALNQLKQVKGIGDKVANCICLYGLGMWDACPIDVWMKRIFDEEYKGKIPEWAYSEYAGYYQQLVFFYRRCQSERL